MRAHHKTKSRNHKDPWEEDVRIAKELGYSDKVIELLKSEPGSRRRDQILRNARIGLYDK